MSRLFVATEKTLGRTVVADRALRIARRGLGVCSAAIWAYVRAGRRATGMRLCAAEAAPWVGSQTRRVDVPRVAAFNYATSGGTSMTAPAAQLNPYAEFLGDASPHDVLEMTAVTIARLIRNSDAAQLTRAPAPGKWSLRDILCHLADCEITFAFRLRQTVAELHHVIQPFDQESWASPYGTLDAHDALDAFTAFRRWNMLFIHAVGAAAESRPVQHPERGKMTFRTIVETMAGHDINHLRQIENLV